NNAELAEATLRRSEELAQRGALSAQQLDEVRSRAASAREQHQSALNAARGAIASLASARVALSQASSALTETTVRAPFAGEIADRMVSVGEYVSPQTPLVTLVRTDPLRLELQVPQQSLRVVRVGQSVDVRVDALPDQRFTATIRYVSAAVRRDTRGLVVEAVIENGQGLLRPGMFATARIDTGQTRRTAVVPASAVLVEAGVNRAFVVHDGVIVERVVTVADRSEGQVVIEEGVTPGESVAIERVGELADGMRVVAPSPAAEPVAPATGS
ncbi:MAG: efflux RND transporter periplasmic adaptor subunit, partial [Sandaracinaceae bacterium]|nr:efflux RND transporter periplasmic adaptor subunit [Sandaracinaceae bacterium]